MDTNDLVREIKKKVGTVDGGLTYSLLKEICAQEMTKLEGNLKRTSKYTIDQYYKKNRSMIDLVFEGSSDDNGSLVNFFNHTLSYFFWERLPELISKFDINMNNKFETFINDPIVYQCKDCKIKALEYLLKEPKALWKKLKEEADKEWKKLSHQEDPCPTEFYYTYRSKMLINIEVAKIPKEVIESFAWDIIENNRIENFKGIISIINNINPRAHCPENILERILLYHIRCTLPGLDSQYKQKIPELIEKMKGIILSSVINDIEMKYNLSLKTESYIPFMVDIKRRVTETEDYEFLKKYEFMKNKNGKEYYSKENISSWVKQIGDILVKDQDLIHFKKNYYKTRYNDKVDEEENRRCMV